VRLYVGNLPYSTTADELRQVFGQHGGVTDVHLPTDRETGRARGFAFIEFGDDEGARAAIEAMDGAELGGRTLKVNEARPRTERPGGGGGDRGGW